MRLRGPEVEFSCGFAAQRPTKNVCQLTWLPVGSPFYGRGAWQIVAGPIMDFTVTRNASNKYAKTEDFIFPCLSFVSNLRNNSVIRIFNSRQSKKVVVTKDLQKNFRNNFKAFWDEHNIKVAYFILWFCTENTLSTWRRYSPEIFLNEGGHLKVLKQKECEHWTVGSAVQCVRASGGKSSRTFAGYESDFRDILPSKFFAQHKTSQETRFPYRTKTSIIHIKKRQRSCPQLRICH